MSSPTTNRPLWQVMYDAYDQSTAPSGLARDWADHHGYAAELRAIAEEIEAHPEAARCIEWGEVADWLRTEADHAEAGE